MSEEFKTLVEYLGAILAALGGAFLALVKTKDAIIGLSNSKPFLRKSITADLELLKLMKETDPGYEELKNHISSQIQIMIKENKSKDILNRDWIKIILGLAMAIGFGYWTYYIITGPASNWWTILTGWMALAGLGFLFGAFQPSAGKADENNANASNE